jgi:hypothetical protein
MSIKEILESAKKKASGVEYVHKEPPDLNNLLDDDATFNFRLNSVLKDEFSMLCKREHLSVAVALKRYMTACVMASRLK